MANWIDADAKCPFFITVEKNSVVCEGITDCSKNVTMFSRKQEFKAHFNIFCRNHYENCEIYRMLMEKYKEEST